MSDHETPPRDEPPNGLPDKQVGEWPGERLDAVVARLVDAPALAASPSSRRLLSFLLETTREDRPITQRDVAEAVFGDADRTQRARGAVRELRRRLAEAQRNDDAVRLEVTQAPWRLRLADGPSNGPSHGPALRRTPARRPRTWQVVVAAPVAAVGLGALAHAVASSPTRGAERRTIACVRFEGGEAVARNPWGEELWRRPARGGSGEPLANALRRKALLDLTRDGRPEVVLATPARDIWPTAPVVAIDGEEREVFRLAAWELIDEAVERDLLADASLLALPPERTGLDEPFVLVALVTREPIATHVALVDASGRRVGGLELEGLFLHAEPLDITGDGVAEIVVGGNVGGAADPHVALVVADLLALSHGAATAEAARLLLPAPLPLEWAGADSFGVRSLQAMHGWLEVELHVGRDIAAWIYLDSGLEPSFFAGDTYALQLRRLVETGRHEGPLDRGEHERAVEASIELVDRRPAADRARAAGAASR